MPMQKVAVHPMNIMKDRTQRSSMKGKDGEKESYHSPHSHHSPKQSSNNHQNSRHKSGANSGGGQWGRRVSMYGGKSLLGKKEVVIGSDMEGNIDDSAIDRCESQMSSASERQDICRICHCEGEEGNKLYSPCLCMGTLKYVHVRCLQKWIKSSEKLSCELCHFDYLITTKTKPFREWEKLDMTTAERRKIICSVAFHIIAITCVIWSLYVLIDRTTEEVSNGNLDWPFWTKLIVVAIGFTGGLVFMYVQCKMYVQLLLRWRTFNRVIQVENVPETEEFRVNALAKIKAKMEDSGGVTNSVALREVESL